MKQWTCLNPDCFLYVCPTSHEVECLQHGGFDVCCDNEKCPAYGMRRDDER